MVSYLLLTKPQLQTEGKCKDAFHILGEPQNDLVALGR